MNFNQLCDDFLKSNEKIRFVGVINSSGNLIVQKNRKDTTSLLTDDETNMLVHYSFSRWKRLENIQHKLGTIKETITKFEKVSTIMLFFKENLFLISTDPKSNNSKIISELWKIIDGKPATRKPVKTRSSKKKPATRKPVKTRSSKKKPATRKPVKTRSSKKKPATRKPVKTRSSKKKPATRKPVKTRSSKKKPATRKPVKTRSSKKPTSGISKKQARSDLTSKLEQLEKRANLLYQKFQK